ncbi:MAG: ORF6N domain-containing protein [Chloroflexi bacterium]|nr:ORF6N domain-containing protein [Chloroflexota bacterium]
MIRTVRGQKVILDRNLAELYGVETKMLNRAVKRNVHRFPLDFAFQLTAEEDSALRCHFGTSKGRGGRRYLPHVFTEHGAIMAANVLQSRQAIEMSIFVAESLIRTCGNC